jgi:hypothetical protein
VRRNKQRRTDHEELMVKVEKRRVVNSVRTIQTWVRGHFKIVRAKRSKVNPAVEQVLKDPERVQNSKMI